MPPRGDQFDAIREIMASAPKANWRRYAGSRIPRAGWRASLDLAPPTRFAPALKVYAYVWPEDGGWRASVEDISPDGEAKDQDVEDWLSRDLVMSSERVAKRTAWEVLNCLYAP